VANDFTNNVAIEDAHDGKGQCNMGRWLADLLSGELAGRNQ
jgi:hypothetical protein